MGPRAQAHGATVCLRRRQLERNPAWRITMNSDHTRPESPAVGASSSASVLPAVDLGSWLSRRGLSARESSPPACTTSAPVAVDRGVRQSGRAIRGVAAYLARIPAAISGQRGHDRTFHAACVLVKGFGLTIEDARPFLMEWNERCVPPWSGAELEHKLQSALAAPDNRPRGYLLSGPAAPPRKERPASRAGSGANTGLCGAAGRHLSRAPGRQPAPPGPTVPGRTVCICGRTGPAVLARGISCLGWLARIVGSPFGEIRARLARSLARSSSGSPDRAGRHDREPDDGSKPIGRRRRPRLLAVTSRLVTDVLQALSGMVLVPAAACPAQPAWIDGLPGAAAPGAGRRDPRRASHSPEPRPTFLRGRWTRSCRPATPWCTCHPRWRVLP